MMRIILFFITIATSILFSQSIAKERFNQKCSKYDIRHLVKLFGIGDFSPEQDEAKAIGS